MRAWIETLYIRFFCRDRAVAGLSILSLLLNVCIWILIALRWESIHQEGRDFITLHYKVFYGPDFYSNWYYIFVLPVAGLLFCLLNMYLGRLAYSYQRIVAYALGATASFCQILLFTATYLIIQINIF